MNVRILNFWLAFALFAASGRPLTAAIPGPSDFDHIALASAPALADAATCIQTQASLVPLAAPEDVPLVDFRKGYCELVSAAITGEPTSFHAAAGDFDKALDAWPARASALARRKQPAEPAPPALHVLAQIARLKAGTGSGLSDAAARDLASALAAPSCPAALMPASLCQALLNTGRQWQGWIALQNGDLDGSARAFGAASSAAWSAWVSGRQTFRAGQYQPAADAYQRAVTAWDAERRQSPLPLADRIAPPVDLPFAYTELGGARLLAGDPTAAIAALNRAVGESPSNSRALYLRARAKDAAGQSEAALADYNLASRTAFANATDLASGEAHLYRGVLLFRRKQYRDAEDEFSSALNFSIAASMRADAIAWRRLSAVAEGSCDAGVRYLEEALPSASPYFPRQEARSFMSACHGL